ncbi:hypothetical protein Tco_1191931 [Tanacetum coccineum]
MQDNNMLWLNPNHPRHLLEYHHHNQHLHHHPSHPQDSSIQGLVTPPTTKAHASGEEQVEDISKGTETPINPVPVAMKTPSVATYKIIKQGEKGVYQIVREDGTDIVYINFGAMLKSISRDDLTELYRIVMNRYGLDGPEDKLEKGFWKYLRIMFEEPLNERFNMVVNN